MYKIVFGKSMKIWEDKEISYLKLNWKKQSDEEIGRKLGRSPRAIFMKRQRLGLVDKSKEYMKTPEYRELMKRINKERHKKYPFLKVRQSAIMSYKCKFDNEHRAKIVKTWFTSEQMSGSNNPKWKGGIRPVNLKIRNSKAMKEWREKVFKKGGYTCQRCGKHGGNLVAHHIKPFAEYPLLHFDVNNGMACCRKCHIYIDGPNH